MHQEHHPLRRDVLFVLLAMGELLRLVALALAGAARFGAAEAPPAAMGAWLLVFLAPHAVMASAFLSLLRVAATAPLADRLLMPAKLIGAVAAAASSGAELARPLRAAVSLAALPVTIPQWAILAGAAAWDLLALVVVAAVRLATKPDAPPAVGAAPPDPARPVYRESEVEELPGAGPDDPES